MDLEQVANLSLNGPYAMAYDAQQNLVYVLYNADSSIDNAGSAKLMVAQFDIDQRQLAMKRSVALSGGPAQLAINEKLKKVYVSLRDPFGFWVLDTNLSSKSMLRSPPPTDTGGSYTIIPLLYVDDSADMLYGVTSTQITFEAKPHQTQVLFIDLKHPRDSSVVDDYIPGSNSKPWGKLARYNNTLYYSKYDEGLLGLIDMQSRKLGQYQPEVNGFSIGAPADIVIDEVAGKAYVGVYLNVPGAAWEPEGMIQTYDIRSSTPAPIGSPFKLPDATPAPAFQCSVLAMDRVRGRIYSASMDMSAQTYVVDLAAGEISGSLPGMSAPVSAMAVDEANGILYLLDYQNNALRVFWHS
jgi:DNA-binding beta-propeller fold protein YncE